MAGTKALWALALAASACPEPARQRCVPECADDEGCVDRTCRQLCDVTSDCEAGRACRRGVCVKVVCGDGIREGNESCDDGNTAGGDACEPDCSGAGATGDLEGSCAVTQSVDVNGTHSVFLAGNTSTATNAHAAAAGSAGPDVTYALNLTGAGKVALQVAVTGDGWEPTLYARDASCGFEVGWSEPKSGVPTRMFFAALSPGTYYVFVDGKLSSDSGPYTLNLAVTAPPSVDANDGCEQALDITNDLAAGSLSRTGLIGTSAGADVSLSCAADCSTGRDSIYRFALTEARTIELILAPEEKRDVRLGVMYEACADADPLSDERYCAAGPVQALLDDELPFLAQGTYYVVVKTCSDAKSGYILEGGFSDD